MGPAPLFDEPGGFDRDGLAAKLSSLAENRIYIGGSSWKYEGWLGQIYQRERYLSRGKFSKKLFEAGVFAPAVAYPTVAEGKARLRAIISAAHKRDELLKAADILAEVGKPLGIV